MSFPIKLSTLTKGVALAATGVLLSTATAQAASFSSIRIGDVDGFGYGDGSGYTAANGNSVNVDGQGMLGNGDFLADLNGDGKMATKSNDNFDYRSSEEKDNSFITGSGFIDNGSSGSKYTDTSLSVSSLDEFYGVTTLRESKQDLSATKKTKTDEISTLEKKVDNLNKIISSSNKEKKRLQGNVNKANKRIKAAEKKIKGFRQEGKLNKINGQLKNIAKDKDKIAGWEGKIKGVERTVKEKENTKSRHEDKIAKLTKESNSLQKDIKAKDAEIAKIQKESYPQESRIPQAEFLFDFTVDKDSVVEDSPFYLNLLFADYDVKDAQIEFTTANTSFTRTLTKQDNSDGQDGLIQSAFVELTFDEVFSAAGDNFDGYVKAKVVAPDEPYLAFDYVEIGATKIDIVGQDPTDIPEPTTALGLLVVGAIGAKSLKKHEQA
ncbi:MAG: hypothetical protein AAF703_09520 [Cyanobacteria bacterium P01_D01_bin.105]